MLRNYLSLVVLLILGSLFSLVGFFTVQKMETQQAHYKFEEAAQERIWVVQNAIRNTLEVLHVLDAFCTTLNEIKREQFNTFASPLLAYHPDISALNWVPRVPHAQRADYETAAQKYYPNFRFTVRRQKQMVTAPQDEEYFPVYYQVSNIKNELLLGFNLASETSSRMALEKARDTGTWQATGPMKLMIDETTQQSGILVVHPIYHQRSLLKTPAQRQEHLRGFIMGVFLLNQIVKKALEHFSAYEPNINILIQDESAPTTERLLYAHFIDAIDQKILLDPISNDLQVKHTFEIAGRTWSILCVPASNYPVGEKNWLSVSTLLSGLLFTMLIIFYVYQYIKYTNHLYIEIIERRSVEAALKPAEENLTKYNQTLEQQVLKRTQQLADNNRLLQQEIQERQPAEESLRESEVLDLGVPRYADNDKFVGYIGSAIEIDEQKRVQEALQTSEGRLKAIFDNVTVGIVLADVEGFFIHCNTKWLEMTGYTYDEITQLTYLEVTHPNDIDLSRKYYEPLIRGKVHSYHLEKRFLRKNGCFFWADVSVTVIKNQNNRFEAVLGVVVDITERKQTEELLLQSEARLIEAQRIAHIGHWERNFITQKVQWSTEVFRIFGLPENTKITPDIFRNAIHPDDRLHVQQAMKQSLCYGKSYHSELRIVLPHGAIRYVQAIGKVIRNTRGKPLSLRGTVQDITERKQIEEALRESETYWRTLIEEALIGLLLIDMKGKIIEANPAYATITGYTLDELHQLSIWDIMPEKLKFESELFNILKTRGRFGPLEQQYINKNGHFIPIRMSGVSVKRKGKHLIWCNVENITEQKQSEAQLQAAYTELQQFKTTLDLTLDGVFIADANSFKFFYVNQGAMNHLGYTQEELLQMTQEDLVPTSMKNCVYDAITPLLKGDELAKTFECLYQHKNGSLIPVEVSIQRISIPGQMTRFVGISRNINERKQTEQTLQQAKEAAEAANRAKSSFLANMSHELRTPLNGILGYAQILKNDPTLSVEHKKGIDIIERSGNYLLTLINDILDLSKIEAGKIELSPTEFNFQFFIQSITDIFSLRAKQKGIIFIYQPLTPLPLEIYADEKRLRQILINLLGNAVKFVKQGEVRLTIGYEPGKKGQIRFQVEDTGIGIATAELDKIFLPFQQAGDTDYRAQGTGLGLSITKKLVEMMGGKLQVKSVLQQGSIFWTILNLPEVRKPALSKPVEKNIIIGYRRTEQQTSPIPHLPFKILVIDDHFENRLVLVKILTPLGFEVMQASDGLDGLEKTQTLQPDLVLLDLMMPVMSGLEFVSQLRQISALEKIIVIAVSASVFSHHRHESLEAGCNDFLPKPIRIEELLKCLQKYLPLEWDYKSKERVEDSNHKVEESNDNETDISTSIKALSRKQALVLFDLGMKGDIMGIIEYAKKLEQENQQLAAVARKICKLAQEFEEEKICDLIEPYLETKK